MPKTVIFDFDGTIADSIPKNPEVVKIFNQLADENNFKHITLAEVERLRDVGLYESIKLLKIPLWKIPFLAKRVRQVVKTDELVSNPVEGVPESLRHLREKGYTLGILTSNKKETVEKFLKAHDLKLFDFVYSKSNLFGKDKALKSLLKKHKLDKKLTLYVGDEIRDIRATRKTGISIIAVSWGYNNKKGLLSAAPEFIAEKPYELENFADRFFTQ